MPVWVWVLIWVLLVLGSVAVLFGLGRSVFRKSVAVGIALGDVSERTAELQAEVARLQQTRAELAQDDEPAVFASPAALRAARHRRFTSRR